MVFLLFMYLVLFTYVEEWCTFICICDALLKHFLLIVLLICLLLLCMSLVTFKEIFKILSDNDLLSGI